MNSRGVTLIELLMVALLLGIGLTGVGGMFTAGMITNQKSANITTAANRASQELERIRDSGFLGVVADTTHFPTPNYTVVSSSQVDFTVSELPSGTGHIYLGLDPEAQAVDPGTGLQIDNLARVRVVISWGGAKSVRGSYSATTLLANRP